MQIREGAEAAELRWADLELLQEHYAEFSDLLIDVIEGFMGFKCSDLQIDIGDWVANGPQYRMVQAQRGQAKTTITAIYAVWRIIHDPTTRILIVSAGSDMATEIANWIIQIINGMPELECLRPDRTAGDRSSVTAFDVHHSLKGPEKSASITCIGITSNMQGKRADILIADDVESSKNSQTAVQRSRLHHLTLDFVSINSKGDILWLGTPQSVDSLYNSLPGRGTAIRIWPGRYPTEKELPDYEGFLAPYIAARLAANPALGSGGGPTGQRGQPTDPVLLDEDTLTKKEIDQGPAYFNLQHMLSTKLSDADRYPLKLPLIRMCSFDAEGKMAPITLGFVRTDQNLIPLPEGHTLRSKIYRVQEASDFTPLQGYHMYVDPTGGGKNGDELAYAVTGFAAGRVYLVDAGGRPGGFDEEVLDWLTRKAMQWKPQTISIEKNYGNGALAAIWLPKLRKAQDEAKAQRADIEEVWETGQKELRIIDVLEPIIGAGKLVMNEDIIQSDWEQCQRYPGDTRQVFSLLWQIARITRDRGSLIHDDRLDAVAGSARFWAEFLSIDDEKAATKAKQDAFNKMMQDPLGNGRPMPGFAGGMYAGGNALNALQHRGIGAVNHLRRR